MANVWVGFASARSTPPIPATIKNTVKTGTRTKVFVMPGKFSLVMLTWSFCKCNRKLAVRRLGHEKRHPKLPHARTLTGSFQSRIVPHQGRFGDVSFAKEFNATSTCHDWAGKENSGAVLFGTNRQRKTFQRRVAYKLPPFSSPAP